MTIPRSILIGAALAAAVTLACSDHPDPAAPALADVIASSGTQATAFSGSATVVRATVLGVTTTLGDAGSLPSSGGAQEASLLSANIPGLLSAEVVHASTVAGGNASRSEASVANVSLAVAGNSITADLLQARAMAMCTGSGTTASGSSEIANLVVNGQPITVTGAPNQTIALPVGEVIINEQTGNGTSDITVNALHVIVTGVADVVISQAHADITCQPVPPPPQPGCPGSDFVTGGGWITGTPSAARANFGVAGGTKQGGLWGHLTYIDHGDGTSVKGTGVTAYSVLSSTARHIEGTAEINGQSGFTYAVDVVDNGEPGRNDDFAITLSNGYSASGTLQGGNIQLHTPCQ